MKFKKGKFYFEDKTRTRKILKRITKQMAKINEYM